MCDCNIHFIGRKPDDANRSFDTSWRIAIFWNGKEVTHHPMPVSGKVKEFVTLQTIINGEPAILAGFTYKEEKPDATRKP